MVTVQGLIIFKGALSCHIFPSELWDIYQENLNFLLIYSIELYSCIIQELYSVSSSCFICWKVRTFSRVSKNSISLPIPIFDQNPRLKILHCCIPGAYWIWVYGLMISRLFNILLHFKLFLSGLIMFFFVTLVSPSLGLTWGWCNAPLFYTYANARHMLIYRLKKRALWCSVRCMDWLCFEVWDVLKVNFINMRISIFF